MERMLKWGGNEIEEEDYRSCVGVAPIVGISSAQPKMSYTEMPIIMSDQIFGKYDIDIELRQIYLSKENIAVHCQSLSFVRILKLLLTNPRSPY